MRIVRNPADGVQKDTVDQEKGILFNKLRRGTSEEDRILSQASKNVNEAQHFTQNDLNDKPKLDIVFGVHGEPSSQSQNNSAVDEDPAMVVRCSLKWCPGNQRQFSLSNRYKTQQDWEMAEPKVASVDSKQGEAHENGNGIHVQHTPTVSSVVFPDPDHRSSEDVLPLQGNDLFYEGWEIGTQVVLINTRTSSLVPATIAQKIESRDKLNNKYYRYNLTLENGKTVWNVEAWRLQKRPVSFNSAVEGTAGLVESVIKNGAYLDQLRKQKIDFTETASPELPTNNITTKGGLSTTPVRAESLPIPTASSKWKRCFEIGVSVTVLHLRTQLWWSGKVTWASPLYDRYNVHLDDTNEIITNVHAMLVDGPSDDSNRHLSKVYTEYVKKHHTRMVHTFTSLKLTRVAAMAKSTAAPKDHLHATVEASTERVTTAESALAANALLNLTQPYTATSTVRPSTTDERFRIYKEVHEALFLSFLLGVTMVLMIQKIASYAAPQ